MPGRWHIRDPTTEMDIVHYSQPAEEAGLNDGVGVSLGWAISCGQLGCT